MVNNTGNTTVDGEGSIGTKITGDNSTINSDGSLVVSGGATGVQVEGNRATVNNTGDVTVRDAGSNGFVVDGQDNAFSNIGDIDVSLNGTGVLISGDSALTTLDGNITVTSVEGSDGVFQGATGVDIIGNNTTTEITGNVTVSGSFDENSVVAGDTLDGIKVTGDDNAVTLDGTLTMDTVDESSNGALSNNTGLYVKGDGNTVQLNGGIVLNKTTANSLNSAYENETAIVTGIAIDGDSDVILSGKSQVNITDIPGGTAILAGVKNAGSLTLDKQSDLEVTYSYVDDTNYSYGGLILASGENSSIDNQGTINSEGMASLMAARSGAQVTNSGEITATSAGATSFSQTGILIANGEGSVVENMAGGNITVTSGLTPQYGDGVPEVPHFWFYNTAYGMLAEYGGKVVNDADATISVNGAGVYAMGASKGTAINNGNIYVDGFKQEMGTDGDITGESYWNGVSNNLELASAGMVAGSSYSGYGDATATNTGTITVNNAGYGMTAMNGGTVINKGTIILTADEGITTGEENQLVGMAAFNGGTVYNDGIININADYGQAFYSDGKNGSTIHNSGTINLNTVEMTDGDNHMGSTPTDNASAPATVQHVSGYQMDTNADGSAGTLNAGDASMVLDNVTVGTGFTAGTAATTETFNDAFVGSDIQGEENIHSASVVWTAEGSQDSSGNVDVTMTKNAYVDVATDSSVSSVAGALDASYTNNELYNSLNVGTTAELNNALKQISGSMATSVVRDARILGNRFDMMALRQKFDFGKGQTLSMEYGIARLDGGQNGISAGNNGVTGGYSQFLGLGHSLMLGTDGLSWDNALRYDVHNLDSNRSVNYGDVSKNARSDAKIQYMELRSEARKNITLSEGFDVAPYAGVKLRHTLEDGYKESDAGDFNLNMSSSTETAVDSVIGLKLSYAGREGWAATATLEGGPNLSYAKNGKTASLQGAAGQNFSVEDGQKGGGINSMVQIGVKYSAGNTSAGLEAFHWREDGIGDKGMMLNFKQSF